LAQIELRERDLSDFFDNASIGLHWVGPDGIIQRVNQTELDLLGYARDEYVGRHIAEFHVDRHVIDDMLRRQAAGETLYNHPARMRAKDGSIRDVLINSNVLFEGGAFVHTRSFTRDITDLKRVEAERQQFVMLADSSQDFVGICDLGGRPSYVNPAGLKTVGLDDLEEARRIPVWDFFFPEDRASIQEQFFPRVLRDGYGQMEVRFRHFKTGEPIWMTYGVVALRDADGELTGLATVSRNITDRKQMEDALREADRRKDEFLAVLAHELRNPLAPIRNSLHILRLTCQQDPAAERVGEMMERQVNHLVRLVDDLMEVSRITRGKIELRTEPVEVAAVIRSAVETSRPVIEAAGHQLALAIPPEPLTLEGDPVRLAQVFANLLNNSAKYTRPGGQILLSVRQDSNEAVISVRDTGVGISAVMLPRVFDMFMQVDRHADRAQGGLGIGLTLVKSLVELHGGSITAHSEGPGRGSEFVVRLPLAAVERRVQDPVKSSPPAVLGPRRVLVVDDNCDAAQSLGMLLKVLGADVRVVYNGPDALEALASYKPDLVLLDIGMPGMDGHEVARRIRQRPEFQDVTLIALTGWGQEEDRRRSQTAGFDYHLIKPADMSALQTLLVTLEGDARGSRSEP
jgi:PAS domain S-box-containing protein